jgi:hypothetical protein
MGLPHCGDIYVCEALRGGARGVGEVRAKEGCGTNPVLCWAGLPDFLQTEGVENGIITAEGVSADVDDRQSYIRRADRGGQRRD